VPAVGSVLVDGMAAGAGDGVAIRDTRTIRVEALEDSELVLVDALG